MSIKAPIRWLTQSPITNMGSKVMPWLRWTARDTWWRGHLAARADHADVGESCYPLAPPVVVGGESILPYVNNVGGILPTLPVSARGRMLAVCLCGWYWWRGRVSGAGLPVH